MGRRRKAVPLALVRGERTRQQALDLRADGLSYPDIAARMGVSVQKVAALIREAMQELYEWQEADVRHLRAQEEEHLHRLWSAVVGPALEGNLAYMDRAIKIRESYRKLHGIDAPAAPLVDARQQTLVVGVEELARYQELAQDPASLDALVKFARGYAESAGDESGQD